MVQDTPVNDYSANNGFWGYVSNIVSNMPVPVKVGLSGLLISYLAVTSGACKPSVVEEPVKEQPVVEEEIIEEEKYSPIFKEKIDIINQENTELADKLIALYEQKPQVAENLSILYQYNATLVELVTKQPWFLDGINEKEEIFINDGLGSDRGSQGVGRRISENDILKKIVENEIYEIHKIQLKGGERNILFIYDNPSLLNPWLELVKIASPMTESFLGITYPKETITVYIRNTVGSYGSNGTVIKNGLPEYLNRKSSPTYFVEELIHAMWETDSGDGAGGGGKAWEVEGIATFVSYYTLEKISKTHPGLLKWSYSVQERYNELQEYAKEYNFLELSIIEVQALNYSKQSAAGFMLFNDLYDLMGSEPFTNMLSELYRLKDLPDKKDIGAKELEYAVFKSAPNNESVKNLFNERVWGK